MADGYARASGRAGVAMATSGPGATNMVTGLATAMLDSSPLVCITGQVPSTVLGTDAFQEVDISGVSLPVTKHSYVVTDINELVESIREAFYIARTGRPGPVLVDVCKDVQNARAEFAYPAGPLELSSYHPAEEVSDWARRRAQIRAWPVEAQAGEIALTAAGVVRQIWEGTGGSGLVVTDVELSYPYDTPAGLMTPGGFGTLGFSLPAAIGASFAGKNREIWVILGDGSMQMSLKELATAVQEQANVKICLLNNGCLGIVRQWQEMFHEGHYVETPMWSPDYVKLAEAYGLPGYRVDRLAEVGPTLRQAQAHPGPVLIEFVVEPGDEADLAGYDLTSKRPSRTVERLVKAS
jgi:thiamine pyrophosphate-dependent acetolactate synthase large subunit-like protein